MMKAPVEMAAGLGTRLKTRRVKLGWTQFDAAARAGVSYRTWRRLEGEGKASIDDLVRAAIALRCEQEFETLFPEPAAWSMDDWLRQQEKAAGPKRRMRAPSRKILA